MKKVFLALVMSAFLAQPVMATAVASAPQKSASAPKQAKPAAKAASAAKAQDKKAQK